MTVVCPEPETFVRSAQRPVIKSLSRERAQRRGKHPTWHEQAQVAETKVAQVIEFSRRHQHPLQCTMEKE